MQAKYAYNSRAHRHSWTTWTVSKWSEADCEKRFERPGAVNVWVPLGSSLAGKSSIYDVECRSRPSTATEWICVFFAQICWSGNFTTAKDVKYAAMKMPESNVCVCEGWVHFLWLLHLAQFCCDSPNGLCVARVKATVCNWSCCLMINKPSRCYVSHVLASLYFFLHFGLVLGSRICKAGVSFKF